VDRLLLSLGTMKALWILATVAIIWLLREARDLLIPIAIGILISYALEPIVSWLERRGITRMVGAGLVMLTVLITSAAAGYAFRDDALDVMREAPRALERLRETVSSQIGIDAGATGGMTDSAKGTRATASAAPNLRALASLGVQLIVVFFLIFFLLISTPRLREQLLEFATSDAEQRHTAADVFDEINRQIQRYLLGLLGTAIMVGALTWAVLAWQHVEHAAMWGILAGLLNSIPYFGPVIVCGGLFVVGLMQGGGMSMALQISGAALLITSLEGWLVTPALMGKAEKMSVLAVFIGLVVWIWLWGEWGTILAVPMLAVVKSVCDHVGGLKRFGRLMAP
jgi:predicted PurR-regulated permease PerM